MFVNFSNHPSEQWNNDQKQAASCFGEIRDMAFPEVSPMATAQDISKMADNCTRQIMQVHPACVMCQGEFSLALAVIGRLQAAGVRCVCACSERKVIEKRLDNGMTQRTSVFEFRQFREYERADFPG